MKRGFNIFENYLYIYISITYLFSPHRAKNPVSLSSVYFACYRERISLRALPPFSQNNCPHSLQSVNVETTLELTSHIRYISLYLKLLLARFMW